MLLPMGANAAAGGANASVCGEGANVPACGEGRMRLPVKMELLALRKRDLPSGLVFSKRGSVGSRREYSDSVATMQSEKASLPFGMDEPSAAVHESAKWASHKPTASLLAKALKLFCALMPLSDDELSF